MIDFEQARNEMGRIRISEWHLCAVENPKTDGVYLVIRFYDGQLSYASQIEYSTKWGWNGSESNHNHVIDFEKDAGAGFNFMWAEVTLQGDDLDGET